LIGAQRKLDSANERNQTLHQALADSTAKEQALQGTLTEQSKQFLAQIKALNDKQAATEAAHHKTRNGLVHFRDLHREAQRRIAVLEPALAQAQTTHDNVSKELQTLKENLAATRAKEDTLRADNTLLLNARDALQTDLTTATAEVSACEARCTALGEEHARLTSAISNSWTNSTLRNV